MSTQLGQYRILGEIARGGMGVLYRGVDPVLQRDVAIKALSAGRFATQEQRERFVREARALAKVRHPNVVGVHQAGEHQGVPYLVMDFVRGEDLQTRIRRSGPLSPPEVVELGRCLADALQHAHEQGVLHRDVKPANVLLTPEGKALLTDFGLSRSVLPPGDDALSQTGVFLGTPGYCPPEQVEGERARIGPPADVYGLGATLYAALTGLAPYEATSYATLLDAVREPPAPPSSLVAGIDAHLEAVCLRCLRHEPEARYPSARALSLALEGCKSAPFGSGGRVWGVALGALGLALALGAGAGVAFWLGGPEGVTAAAPEPASVAEPVAGSHESQDATPFALPVAPPELYTPDLRRWLEAQDWEERVTAAEADLQRGTDPTARRRLLEALAGRATLASRQGKPWPAVADFRRCLELDPGADAWKVYATLGSIYNNERQHHDALEALGRALQLNPSHRESYVTRASIRYTVGLYAEAQLDFTQALGLGPPEAQLFLGRGMVRDALKDAGGAIEDYSQALNLKPDSHEAKLNRGLARAKQGDVPGALEDLDQVTAALPDFAEGWAARGVVHVHAGDLRRALADFDRCLELQPRDIRILLQRGEARARLGDFERAREDFVAAREILPEGHPQRSSAERAIAQCDELLQQRR